MNTWLYPGWAQGSDNEKIREGGQCDGRPVAAESDRDDDLVTDGGTEACTHCERDAETDALGLCIVCADAYEEGRIDPEIRTDGGHPQNARRKRDPLWIRDGGDGLPVPDAHDADKFWLFTCCQCGRRWVDPPAPVSGCGCGSEEIVCHRFDPDDYWAIKHHGDPRVRTDGGTAQTDLGRDPTTREVARCDTDDDKRPVCPDCGQYVGASMGGGKPLPDHDATAFGWECSDCELTLPSNCHGPAAPMFNDHMAGLEVLFRDGLPRWVPVPARFVEDDDPEIRTDGGVDAIAAIADELERDLAERLGVDPDDIRIRHTREGHPGSGIGALHRLRAEWVDRDDEREVRTDGGRDVMSSDGRSHPWVNQIHQGDALETLREMADSSVHMAQCSPPYFGLRDYGEDVETVWGGDGDCDHVWTTETKPPQGGTNTDENPPNTGADSSTQESRIRGGDGVDSDRCLDCGAWRGQLGLEPQLDQFINNLVVVGDELRRVLRDDGSWWLNLGDSFAGSWGAQSKDGEANHRDRDAYPGKNPARHGQLRRKSKMLVPHRVAIALEDAGWIVRSDAVWSKPNPMPHPVKDRLHEHKEFLFHLTPEPDYWFDLDAIREPHKETSVNRATHNYESSAYGSMQMPREDERESVTMDAEDALHPNGKNPGDVLEISVKAFPEAHFAVYPPELCETPIKSSCPTQVCAQCGAPYERVVEVTRPWNIEDPERDQLRRAQELADKHGLTEEHFEAIQAVGINDESYGQLTLGGGDNTPEKVKLAAVAKQALGAYFREFIGDRREPTDEFEETCDCDTDETEPGIVLDPFAGAGTTCMVAKDLGRRFVGIDLNPEYVALAQKRVGVTVDESERLLEEDQQTLLAATDGGEASDMASTATEQEGCGGR